MAAQFRPFSISNAIAEGQQDQRVRKQNALLDVDVANAPVIAQQQNRLGEQQIQANDTAASDHGRKAEAERIYTAVQYGLNSADPRAFIQQELPELAQQLQQQGANLDSPEAAREALQHAAAHFGSLIGKVPEQYTLNPGDVRMSGDRQIAAAPAAPEKGTDDQREYQQAVTQGFKGSFVDYMTQMRRAGATSIDMRSPPSAPQGQVYVPDQDPNNKLGYRLENIPGAKDPRTEAQQKAGLLATRMQSLAADIVDTAPTITTQMIAKLAQGGGAVGGFANEQLSPDQQKHFNAARGWLAGVLRQDTGATIQPFEIAEYYPTFFPVPGDSPPVIEQKRKLRQVTQNAISANGGGQRVEAVPLVPQPPRNGGWTIREVPQ